MFESRSAKTIKKILGKRCVNENGKLYPDLLAYPYKRSEYVSTPASINYKSKLKRVRAW